MWKFYLVLLLISIAFTNLAYTTWMFQRDALKTGTLVTVQVTQKDDCTFASTVHNFKFIYNGKLYCTLLNELYCDSFAAGNNLQLIRANDGRFIFPKEDSTGSKLGFWGGLLFCLALVYATIKTYITERRQQKHIGAKMPQAKK
jgi:hypothetical protein